MPAPATVTPFACCQLSKLETGECSAPLNHGQPDKVSMHICARIQRTGASKARWGSASAYGLLSRSALPQVCRRTDYTFWYQCDKKPSIIPGCPKNGVILECAAVSWLNQLKVAPNQLNHSIAHRPCLQPSWLVISCCKGGQLLLMQQFLQLQHACTAQLKPSQENQLRLQDFQFRAQLRHPLCRQNKLHYSR